MGSTDTKTKSTQTSTPNVPGWIQAPQQQYVGRVQGLMDNWGQQVQGPTAQQNQAFSYKGDMNPILNNTSKYMNQFEDQVVGNALNDNERARRMAINAGQAQATAAGAFGGSRHGVADSLTNEDYLRNAGTLASNIRYQGYNNAQNAALQDAQNNRSSVGLLANLGEQQRQLLAMQNDQSPESLAIAQGLLGYNPGMYVGNTTTGTTKQSGGGVGQALGGIGSLAMGLGSGGLGFGVGGLLGGAGGVAGAASGFTPGWLTR